MAGILAFAIFIIIGAAMFTWLIPLIYVQLQSFVLDIPRLFNKFLTFVSTMPATFPDLVDSDQISIFFQAVSSELSSITQNIVKSSIAGIQSAITVLIFVILFPILVYFFLSKRCLPFFKRSTCLYCGRVVVVTVSWSLKINS